LQVVDLAWVTRCRPRSAHWHCPLVLRPHVLLATPVCVVLKDVCIQQTSMAHTIGWLLPDRQREQTDRRCGKLHCDSHTLHVHRINQPVHKSSHLESRYGPHAHSGQVTEHNVHIGMGLAHSIELLPFLFVLSLPLVHTFTHTHTHTCVSHEAK
jgi:hypothetical protein